MGCEKPRRWFAKKIPLLMVAIAEWSSGISVRGYKVQRSMLASQLHKQVGLCGLG